MRIKRSLIIGASGGIGAAMTNVVGGEVTQLSRRQDGFDVTDEASIAKHLQGLSGPFDLIFVATGSLVIDGAEPEKAIRSLTPEALIDQYRTNAVGPILVLKHALRLMPAEAPSCFAALSARVGSIGDNRIGGWHSYRAAKAGLNQLIHGAAIELKRTHKQAVVLALHPGTVDTAFTRNYRVNQKLNPDDAARRLLNVIKTRRPSDSGKFFDHRGTEIPW